jgi:zinc and cadmium transporter
MLLQTLLLFLAAFLGGMVVLIIRRPNPASWRLPLIFSGGYLFAITFLHILPELFVLHANARLAGLYVLVGFFLQLVLERFSQGVEHGHLYDTDQGEHQHTIAPLTLMAALFLHAFSDGIILNDPSVCLNHHHGANTLLIGILLHKVPESFALVSILTKLVNSRRKILIYLFIFALAAPLGLLGSSYVSQQQWFPTQISLALWGIVSGSLVHIATTIFFEASPCHQPNTRKFMASLLGAVSAVICEFLL